MCQIFQEYTFVLRFGLLMYVTDYIGIANAGISAYSLTAYVRGLLGSHQVYTLGRKDVGCQVGLGMPSLRALRHCLRLCFSVAGFSEGSLFHGTDISERVHVSWGTFALVEATRALMRASLEDPLNQKFVLLSEAGIPLYPPDLIYLQLMSEDKSRINSCVDSGVSMQAPQPASQPPCILSPPFSP